MQKREEQWNAQHPPIAQAASSSNAQKKDDDLQCSNFSVNQNMQQVKLFFDLTFQVI